MLQHELTRPRSEPAVLAGLVGVCALLVAAAGGGGDDGLSARDAPGALANYGRLPLSFAPNVGQGPPDTRFMAQAGGVGVSLGSRGLGVRVSRRAGRRGGTRATMRSAGIGIAFAGARPVRPASDHALPGRANYFLGNDRSRWRTNVPTFGRVGYRGVWPGVDAVFHGNAGRLEYDFAVAPRADPGRIALRVVGARRVRIDRRGNLVAGIGGGSVRLERPRAYQVVHGRHLPVASRFLLGRGIVRFGLGRHDRSRPLVIDPVLVYSTYLGGDGSDGGAGIAVDAQGNAYVTGVTGSPETGGGVRFPTKNPYQATYNGNNDAFVAKINAAGTALVYSTYLGGDGADEGHGIAVDKQGNAYVAGLTTSPITTIPFPTQNAYQSTNNGTAGNAYNAFVTKLNPDGNAVLYSTYLGGDGAGSVGDEGNGIAVDAAGNAYVVGTATSHGTTAPAGFPTKTPIQPNNNAAGSGSNTFVTKINTNGTGSSSLVYSTYLGGTSGDLGLGIAADGTGNAYITGRTSSTAPAPWTGVPPGTAIQPTFGGGLDAFVAKVNAAGNALVYSTYLGGSDFDFGNAIAVDTQGNAYVTGATKSAGAPPPGPGFPTANPIQPSNKGDYDVFVTKLNAAGSALAYSTYLGGSGEDRGNGIAVDAHGNAYVVGQTKSPGSGSIPFPTVDQVQASGAGPPTGAGGVAVFTSKLTAAGSALAYSTYLGTGYICTPCTDAIAVDSHGAAYITGVTTSFPTVNPIQASNPDASTVAFVAKLVPSSSPPPKCTVTVPSPTLSSASARVNVGSARKKKRPKKPAGLAVVVRCDQVTAVSVTGKVAVIVQGKKKGKKKPPPKTTLFQLSRAGRSVLANQPKTLRLRLSRSALRQVKKLVKNRHGKASARLTLVGSNANGRTTASTRVPRLKVVP